MEARSGTVSLTLKQRPSNAPRQSSRAWESPVVASAIGVGCGLWLVAVILASVGIYSLTPNGESDNPLSKTIEAYAAEHSTCPCACKDRRPLRLRTANTTVHLPFVPSLRTPVSTLTRSPEPLLLPSLAPPQLPPAPKALPQVPLLAVPRQVQGYGQALQIPLRKLAASVPLALGTAPVPPPAAVPVEPAASSSGRDAGSTCRAGDTCAYGMGWCSRAESLKLQRPKGFCKRGVCTGPTVAAYPNATCGSPEMKQTNVTAMFRKQMPKWLEFMRDVEGFNRWVRGLFRYYAVHDIELDFDRVLLKGLDMTFDRASGVWLVGCWPPRRYVVADGTLRLPSGRMVLRAAGFSFVVSFYDLSLHFKQLRADVACHAGRFSLVSVTQGSEGRKFSAEALSATGEVNIHCEQGWTLMCLLLGMGYRWLSDWAVAQLPGLVAAYLDSIDGQDMGEGCETSWHNTVSLLPYASQQCCEETYAVDRWGCLVGGQFNGRVRGVKKVVEQVKCQSDRSGTFTAVCESLPGHYRELSPGVCREGPLPPWVPWMVNPGWEQTHWSLQTLCWADFLLSCALLWTLAICCCGARGLRPAPASKRGKYLPYLAA